MFIANVGVINRAYCNVNTKGYFHVVNGLNVINRAYCNVNIILAVP